MDLFAHSGDPARFKLVVLAPESSLPEDLLSRVRSLNFTEHVSPAALLRREISRPASSRPRVGEEATIARLRRWFWSRKPDAGFILWEFPATLLQALVFDEWLEARNESLAAVLTGGTSSPLAVVEHYRSQGLLVETGVSGLPVAS